MKSLLCMSSSSSIPGRDTPISFGKHKGKLLGTLPPNYLRWVSQTLRAGESLRWALLADQVLRDPVYRDRAEWDLAHSLLSGSGAGRVSVSSELAEMSERFGWDCDDADGWRKVDFAMIGTSRTGRIPRKKLAGDEPEKTPEIEIAAAKAETKREERREKARAKRREEEILLEKEEDIGEEINEKEKKKKKPLLFPGRQALLRNVRNTFS